MLDYVLFVDGLDEDLFHRLEYSLEIYVIRNHPNDAMNPVLIGPESVIYVRKNIEDFIEKKFGGMDRVEKWPVIL